MTEEQELILKAYNELNLFQEVTNISSKKTYEVIEELEMYIDINNLNRLDGN